MKNVNTDYKAAPSVSKMSQLKWNIRLDLYHSISLLENYVHLKHFIFITGVNKYCLSLVVWLL